MPQPQIQINKEEAGNATQNENKVVIFNKNSGGGYPLGKGVFIGYIINFKDLAEGPIKKDMERQLREQILLKQSFGDY